MKKTTNIRLFKPYLQVEGSYKGGKAKSETDKKIYKLSSNENMLGSSPKALAAINKQLTSLNIYPDNTDQRLINALSNFYNGQLTPQQFITTNSGVAILELIINAFLEEGLECIVSAPAFSPYMMFTQKVGGNFIDVPLKGDNFELDVDGIIAAINENTRLIFITNPNNPTGTYIPKAKIDALVAQMPDHIVLVFDEVYFQYVAKEDYTRALPYVLEGKQVIGVNSFSKAYGLAGMRIGYAYSTPKIATYVRQLLRPFMINTLALEAAIAALTDHEFIEQTVNLVNTEKVYLYKELDALGVKYWKSETNFILIKPEINDLEFEAKMFEQGIMVRPVANFGAPDCIRVSIGTHEANQAFIEAYKVIKGK